MLRDETPVESPQPRLVVDAHSTSPSITILHNRDVVFTDERFVPSVRYHNLQALNDPRNTWDEIYFLPAPRFELRMRKGEIWVTFNQEIGNEAFGVFSRYTQMEIPGKIENRQYLAQDGTWKPITEHFGNIPQDAIRIPIFQEPPEHY